MLQGPVSIGGRNYELTAEILASKHDITALKVKQGHIETAILVLHNFVVFHYG